MSTEYQRKVLRFLDIPWQEDREIEFVALVEESRNRIAFASDTAIRNYLRRLWEGNKESILALTSDRFIEALDELTEA